MEEKLASHTSEGRNLTELHFLFYFSLFLFFFKNNNFKCPCGFVEISTCRSLSFLKPYSFPKLILLFSMEDKVRFGSLFIETTPEFTKSF